MSKRRGFTLVELLVSMVLILFIMLILSEAFHAALTAFRKMKAIGDMQERMRSATTALRRDLSYDHFEGKRRLSDPAAAWNLREGPREGFFYLRQDLALPGQNEGSDADGIAARRRTTHSLHFSIKVRGNSREHFLSATGIPTTSPLRTMRTTFFDHPADARYQDGDTTYNSQWAEVAYFLVPNNTSAGSTPLFTLYRSQLVAVPDNSKLNWPNLLVPLSERNYYTEVSCQPQGTGLYFNNPTDLVHRLDPLTGQPRRAYAPGNPYEKATTVILTDVISFDVQYSTGGDYLDLPVGFKEPDPSQVRYFDTGDVTSPRPARLVIQSLRVTLRVWDLKTEQARQITMIQEM
jgi:prepilin-type N-terminal cleavage/methylation domain-containing protein